MKSHKVDVVVAGGGPVGLTAALFLRKEGLSVTVAEARSGRVTHSYALALHPATLELLDDIGIAEPLLEQACRVEKLTIYQSGQRVASVPVASAHARFPFIAVVGQDVIERTLGAALAARGVETRWNTRVSRFEQSETGVQVICDELEQRVIGYAAARFDWLVRKSHTLDARFLVGADGHQSLVRRQLSTPFPEVAPAEHYAVYEFEAEPNAPAEVSLVLHHEGMAVYWPLPDGRARWSFSLDPKVHADALREKDHEPVQIIGPGVYPALEEAFFSQLLERRVPHVRVDTGKVYWRMLVRFEKRLAESFGSGRIWLAGDAGHLTAPAGIQSMNVGMREARDLARAMARAGAQAGSRHEALERYGEDRLQEWRRLLALEQTAEPTAAAAPELAALGSRIVSSLPASGPELQEMGSALGFRIHV